MARVAEASEDKTIETWEATTDVTVWVWVYDKREDKYKKQRVGGRSGSKKLHIRHDDRIFNQEQVVDENRHLDPFTNGLLRLVDGRQEGDEIDTSYHLTADDLKSMLEIRDEDVFRSEVEGITSELIIRRLKDLSEKYGQVWQRDFLVDLVEERYKVGGTQKSVREMMAEDDAGIRLS